MNLIIRADASIEMGTGHIMRCLALAQAWQNAGGQSVFVMATSVTELEQRILLEGIGIIHLLVNSGTAEDANKTTNLAQQLNANWIVVDGYHFGADYQRIIKDFGLSILFIDDYAHADYYCADLILNQNVYAHEGMYVNRGFDTQLLLGTRYALLRGEFLQWQRWQRSLSPKARKILVTLGGSDSNNVTLKVIQALQLLELNELTAVVVVGAGNPHYEQLLSASQKSLFPIRIEKNVTDMPELMAWADVAITAGGSTCWELALMGLPSLIITLAENQRAIAQKLDSMGVFIHLGWYEDISAAEIASVVTHLLKATHTQAEMSKRAQELVDGEGSKRVLRHLDAKLLKLRLACQEDCRLFWEWSNDPEVRAVSFSTEPIPWEHHVQWFQSRLQSPNSILYLGVNRNDVPIGQIRYDIEGNKAIISITLDKKFRYQGYGSYLINLGCNELFLKSNINIIYAYIKPNNQSSIQAFLKASFENKGNTKLGKDEAVKLVRIK